MREKISQRNFANSYNRLTYDRLIMVKVFICSEVVSL